MTARRDASEPVGQRALVGGRYRLDGVIGRGGFGVVHRATDELLRRQVAVKEVLLPTDGSEEEGELARERVLREARAAGRLHHPGAVAVLDVISDGDLPWIVMEFVDGQSLSMVIEERGALSVAEVCRIGISLAYALEAAHRLGIVHRDVKPSNVLITADQRARLTDFGIAVSHGDSRLTSTGMVLGSPAYLAPERARGDSGSAASDRWGLGATLFTSVEGVSPFPGTDPMSILAAVVQGRREPFRAAGRLAPVIDGLMAPSEARRPSLSTARARMREILEHDSRGRPLRARSRPSRPAVTGVTPTAGTPATLPPATPPPAVAQDGPAATGPVLDETRVLSSTADRPGATGDNATVRVTVVPTPTADVATPAVSVPTPTTDVGAGVPAPAEHTVPVPKGPEVSGPMPEQDGGAPREDFPRGDQGDPERAGGTVDTPGAGTGETDTTVVRPARPGPPAATPRFTASRLTSRLERIRTMDRLRAAGAGDPGRDAGADDPARDTNGPRQAAADSTRGLERMRGLDRMRALGGIPARVPDVAPPAGPGPTLRFATPKPSGTVPAFTATGHGAGPATTSSDAGADAGAGAPSVGGGTGGGTAADGGRVGAADGADGRAGAGADAGSRAGTRSGPGRRAVILVALAVVAVLVAVLFLALRGGGDDASDRGANPAATAAPGSATDENSDVVATDSTPVTAPPGWVSYVDPSGWSIAYPARWERRPGPGGVGNADFVDTATGTFMRIGSIARANSSAIEAWRRNETSFRDQVRDYRRVRIEPGDGADGARQADWEFTYASGGGTVHVLNRGAVRNGHGYALYWHTAEELWAEGEPLMRQLLSSFRPAS